MPRAEERELRDRSVKAAGTSAAVGTLYGGLGALLSGVTNRGALLKAMAKDAALAATMGGGGYYVGSKILGPKGDDEPTGNTRRGTLGGGLIGSVGGGLYGALAGSGVIKPNTERLLTRYFGKLAMAPSKANALKGALTGAAAMGGLGAYLGSDEGMILDFVDQEKAMAQRADEEMKRRMQRQSMTVE